MEKRTHSSLPAAARAYSVMVGLVVEVENMRRVCLDSTG